MPKLERWVVCAGLALGLLGGGGGMAQTTPSAGSAGASDRAPQLIPRTHEERERRFLVQHRIVLNVEVADGSGKPSPNLSQTDFTLLDNEQPQKLISFATVSGETAKPSPHVIVVVDAVNNFGRHLHFFEHDLKEYLQRGQGPLVYPFAIGILRESGIDVGDSTRDRGALLADLAARTANLQASGCIGVQDRGDVIDPSRLNIGGGVKMDTSKDLTCQNERFIASVTALHRLAEAQVDVPGRVILIWLGSGWPLLTNKAFKADTADVKRNNFTWMVELSNSLREAQITVDAVESPDNTTSLDLYARGADFYEGVNSEEQMKAGDLGLHALAHQTGGHVLTETDLQGEIRTCLADASAYYVLKFDAPVAGDFGEYHSLAVKVNKPGMDVRTNAFYYAEQ